MEKQEVSNKFDGEEVGQVKMSKVEKFFLSQREKLNKHLEGLEGRLFEKLNVFSTSTQTRLDNFVEGANAQITKMDKRFSGMYNTLLREFLSKLEDRIYTSELSNKTMLMIFSEKFHKIESDLNKLNAELGTSLDRDTYMKELETLYVAKMTEIHNETVKAHAETEAQKETVNVEASKEVVEEPVQQAETSPEVAQ